MCGHPEKDIPEVPERLHASEFASPSERVEKSGAVCAFHAAGEEPVLPADGHDAKHVLGAVVVELQPAIQEKASEGLSLVVEIAQCLSKTRLRKRRPREVVPHAIDVVQDHAGLLTPKRGSLFIGQLRRLPLDFIEALDQRQHLQRIGIALFGVEELTTHMRPAPDLRNPAGAVQRVVRRVGIGLKIAAEGECPDRC